MEEIWNYFLNNKEWIFSGVGVAVVSFILYLFRINKTKSNKQYQKGGTGSVSIQAGKDISIKYGINYEDAKKIAKDVFEENFIQLQNIAKKVAFERASALIEDFLRELKKRSSESVQVLQEPDMQYQLFFAQKEYARSGDENLSEILVDLLVERAKEYEHSILQIVLNEAISTVPKLLPTHLDILSIVFLIKYTQLSNISDLSTLKKFLNLHTHFVKNISTNATVYRHLEYANCCTIFRSVGGLLVSGKKPLIELWKTRYSGLFSNGFTTSELKENLSPTVKISDLPIITCKKNPDKLQFDLMSVDEFNKIGLDSETTKKIIALHNSHLISDEDARELILSWVPDLENLLDIWHKSDLYNMSLTSVGIALANANIRRKTNEEFDLGIWIN